MRSSKEKPSENRSSLTHQGELGLGCWAFGDPYWHKGWPGEGGGPSDLHRSYVEVLHSAIARGIRHFDTAQGYGNGISEQVVGQQLRKTRGDMTIATKTYFRPADTVRGGIEKSLKRMGTPYIDIFYLHWPKPGRDLRPHIEALEQARRDGLIRSIGVSNFRPEQVEPLLQAGRIDYCQFGYSLLWRSPEKELIPFCRDHDIRIVTYGSLSQGLLAHPPEWADSLPEDDPRRQLLLMRPHIWPRVRSLLTELSRESDSAGISPAQLALGWNLSRPWVRYVLFGARNNSQVRECTAAAHLTLPEDLLDKIEKLSAGLVNFLPEEDNIFGHHP